MKILKLSLLLLSITSISFAQGFRQTQTDSYTRYELLNPSNQSFRIIYDVRATTAGVTKYFNGLRVGSEHLVDAVWDLMTGKELNWEIVNGVKSKENGLSNAN